MNNQQEIITAAIDCCDHVNPDSEGDEYVFKRDDVLMFASRLAAPTARDSGAIDTPEFRELMKAMETYCVTHMNAEQYKQDRAALVTHIDKHVAAARNQGWKQGMDDAVALTQPIAAERDAALADLAKLRSTAGVGEAQPTVIHQVQMPTESGSSTWHDASEEAFHTFTPAHRRILYSVSPLAAKPVPSAEPCPNPAGCNAEGCCNPRGCCEDAAPVSAAPTDGYDWITYVVREIAEFDDRDSPEDQPDMMLVTAEELREVIERHAPSAGAPLERKTTPRLRGKASQAFIAAHQNAEKGVVAPVSGAGQAAPLVFMDQLPAGQRGEEWVRQHLHLGSRLEYADNSGPAVPRVQWCLLLDSHERVVAGYLMTRDAKNWTQLTLVGPTAAPADAQELPAHEDFAAWLAREMPAGTVIGDPAWWAPCILRAALARRQSHGEEISDLEYRGNSVAYIHQKMEARGLAIERAWDALREAGFSPDGTVNLADMIRRVAAAKPAGKEPS